MGSRWTVRSGDKGVLAEIAATPLEGVCARAGWTLQRVDIAGEPALRGEPDGPILFDDGVALRRLPTLTLRDLGSHAPGHLFEVLRWMADSRRLTMRELERGQKRWSVGGLAHEARLQGAEERLRPELGHLARLVGMARVGDSWIEQLGRELPADDTASTSIFGVPALEERALVELDPVRLERLLTWASSVERFHVQPGARAPRPDADEWDGYLRRQVELLRAVAPNDLVLVTT